MPFYQWIEGETKDGERTAKGLLKLKEALEEKIPKRTMAGTLLLATWNIREFDSTKNGERKDEPIYYISEIIDRIDVVAVQEVRDDLTALERRCRNESPIPRVFSKVVPSSRPLLQ